MADTAASAENVRSPQAVTSEEIDLSTVRVVLIIPGLQTLKKYKVVGPHYPTKDTVHDVKFEERSLEVSAAVTDKKSKVTKYFYKVNKLPGEIDTCKSRIEFKKGQIILILVKKEGSSWAVQLSKSGLDQAPDED